MRRSRPRRSSASFREFGKLLLLGVGLQGQRVQLRDKLIALRDRELDDDRTRRSDAFVG